MPQAVRANLFAKLCGLGHSSGPQRTLNASGACSGTPLVDT
jgi:hypothetical protein